MVVVTWRVVVGFKGWHVVEMVVMAMVLQVVVLNVFAHFVRKESDVFRFAARHRGRPRLRDMIRWKKYVILLT